MNCSWFLVYFAAQRLVTLGMVQEARDAGGNKEGRHGGGG